MTRTATLSTPIPSWTRSRRAHAVCRLCALSCAGVGTQLRHACSLLAVPASYYLLAADGLVWYFALARFNKRRGRQKSLCAAQVATTEHFLNQVFKPRASSEAAQVLAPF